jgi:hypothetical protein
MMNIGLHHRGVDAELLAILQSKIDRGLKHQVIDGFEGRRVNRLKLRLNVSWRGTGWE